MSNDFFLVLLQIVTESLPISSGGHVFIFKKLFSIGQKNLLFDILEPLSYGATIFYILAVFWRDWIELLRNFFTSCAVWRLFSFIVIADVITSFFYIIFRVLLADALWLSSDLTILFGMTITMVLLLSLRLLSGRGYTALSLPRVLAIGFVQGLAFLPGISRFASTYVAGRWLGVSPRQSLQFSFLIFFPLACGEFLRALVKVCVNSEVYTGIISVCSVQSLIFVIISTMAGYFGLRLAYGWGISDKLWRFGLYMVIPCSILLWLILT